MPNGFGWGGGGFGWGGGFGRGRGGGGWGFGFRGSSPPWPFVGLGRGGLPRCGYFLSGAAGAPPAYWPSPYPSGAWAYGGYPAGAAYPGTPAGTTAPGLGVNPYAPPLTPEQELDFLRGQAEAIKSELEQIQNRIQELEKE